VLRETRAVLRFTARIVDTLIVAAESMLVDVIARALSELKSWLEEIYPADPRPTTVD